MLLFQHQGHDGNSDSQGQSHLGQDQPQLPERLSLELQDPGQNTSFLDHYLSLPVDLSKVLSSAQPESPRPSLSYSEILVCSQNRHNRNTDITETSLSLLLAVGS